MVESEFYPKVFNLFLRSLGTQRCARRIDRHKMEQKETGCNNCQQCRQMAKGTLDEFCQGAPRMWSVGQLGLLKHHMAVAVDVDVAQPLGMDI